jgi:hypothetical protein
MIKFEVIKKETLEPVEIFTDVKDIKYYKEYADPQNSDNISRLI